MIALDETALSTLDADRARKNTTARAGGCSGALGWRDEAALGAFGYLALGSYEQACGKPGGGAAASAEAWLRRGASAGAGAGHGPPRATRREGAGLIRVPWIRSKAGRKRVGDSGAVPAGPHRNPREASRQHGGLARTLRRGVSPRSPARGGKSPEGRAPASFPEAEPRLYAECVRQAGRKAALEDAVAREHAVSKARDSVFTCSPAKGKEAAARKVVALVAGGEQRELGDSGRERCDDRHGQVADIALAVR